MSENYRLIPYGAADFAGIQKRNNYYVDKTHFIPLLEENLYTFLIRPRRFGKSLWLSILESYYDLSLKDRFPELFKNTWIGENPTAQQGTYLVLTFDFSVVRAEPELVEDSFNGYVQRTTDQFIQKYAKPTCFRMAAWKYDYC